MSKVYERFEVKIPYGKEGQSVQSVFLSDDPDSICAQEIIDVLVENPSLDKQLSDRWKSIIANAREAKNPVVKAKEKEPAKIEAPKENKHAKGKKGKFEDEDEDS
jgi:hypothetical protein